MLSIGLLAERTGTNIETIRYYERAELLARPSRTAGNQRRYPPVAVDRLRFIRHARELGFSLDAIRQLVNLRARRDQSCAQADAIAREHLAEVDRKIAMLGKLRIELTEMIHGCAQDTVARCNVIETLADHGKCVTHHDRA
jgi:DNA-binding transcriptional MerR regulator